ncbi:MAG TPA: hypothetical protein VI815_02515 [Candidatus Nanoarchaeia archaeon]|nr:hypothetical protein [Candidatus Nanoarchaeia archaeon]
MNFEEKAYSTLKTCTHYCVVHKGIFRKRKIIFAFKKNIGTNACLRLESSKKGLKVINAYQYIADDGFSVIMDEHTTVNVSKEVFDKLEECIIENLNEWK